MKKIDMNTILFEYGVTPFPDKVSEAMAYIPYQPNDAKTYMPVQGFEAGTMFPCLNKPFYGSKCEGDEND